MNAVRVGIFIAVTACLCPPGALRAAQGQTQPAEERQKAQERIITAEEVKQLTSPGLVLPLRILSYPHRVVCRGMERGLISFEQRKIRERFQEWTDMLRSRGVEGSFGGSGEGAGFGGGGSYTFRPSRQQAVRIFGLATFKSYQELDVRWSRTEPGSRIIVESSYQWRPQENFYGLGHDSLKSHHSNFALRQAWAGSRVEITPTRRLQWGALYKISRSKAQAGRNPLYASPNQFFSDLPGFGTVTRLQSVGSYIDLDFLQDEYQWGGAGHWGASYHKGLGNSNLEYFAYEMQLEGRLPLFAGASALVGQANVEFSRPRGGSDPVPFYLLPHIGGSSTLRGFALDRFYGKNLILLSLEYRYRLHPNIQAIPFFDEGQIFDRTSDLGWLNWHRNYGIGLRFRTIRGTFMRVAYGRGKEGFQFHIVFGDRDRPPLRAPVRYGAYKR